VSEIGDRIKSLAKEHAFGNISAFAKYVGIPRPTLYPYLKGERTPNAEQLILIANKTGCDLHWLLTGDGEMQRDGILPTQAPNNTTWVTALDTALLEDIIRLVEDVLSKQSLMMDSKQKSKLIGYLYDIYIEEKPGKLSIIEVENLMKLIFYKGMVKPATPS
jgi:transcriptional regulator with XRE-family HTH domain